ncbi:hypothetical protein ACFQX7_29930 [Luedemannella flava]
MPPETARNGRTPTRPGSSRGAATKRTGQIFVKKSGTVIQNIDLLGDVRIEANNVTVRNVRIRNPSSGGPTYWGILQWEGYKGLVVEHVDIIGSTKEEMTKGIDNLGGMVTVRYSDISGISKKAIDTQHGLIENNYLHDPHHFPQADGEVDMIRVTGGPAKGLNSSSGTTRSSTRSAGRPRWASTATRTTPATTSCSSTTSSAAAATPCTPAARTT